MKLAVWGVLLAVVALSCPVRAYADPITLFRAQRFVTTAASTSSDAVTDQQWNSDFLVSDSTSSSGDGTAIASGSLFSRVSASGREFSGTGSLSATNTSTGLFAGATAASTYLVTFDLSAPQQFLFSGDFASTGQRAEGAAVWHVEFFLQPADGGVPLPFFEFLGHSNQNVGESGFVGPGRYGLVVEGVAETYARTLSSMVVGERFGLTFADVPPGAPTPEPASLVLLLGGGLVAALRRSPKERSVTSGLPPR